MKSKFTRLAVIASCAFGISGVAASSAFAVANPVAASATKVTPESAVLNGTIDPGTGGASYTIAYDTASDLAQGGDNTQYAGPFFQTGGAPVAISVPIGCYPSLLCGVDSTPLLPNTKYVATIQVQPGVTGKYYYTTVLTSNALTFKTKSLGSIVLASTKIPVVKGKAKVSLKCKGSEKCAGRITLSAKLKKHAKTATTCGSAKYFLTGGSKETAAIKLSRKCLVAIAKSPKLTLAGRIVVTSLTDQKGINKGVKLTLSSAKK